MRRASIAIALAAIVVAVCVVADTSPSIAGAAQAAPRSFFGIVPQAVLYEEDARYMRAARIGSIRLPIGWESIQPTKRGPYNWEGTDREVATAVNQGLRSCRSSPACRAGSSHKTTTLPIDSARARSGWTAFVKAGGQPLRAGRGILGRTHPAGGQGRHRRPPAETDPRLADLERGQLLLLRLPGLADPLRPPAEDQLPGGQVGRPERSGAALRPLRRTGPGRQARHGRQPSSSKSSTKCPGIKHYFDAVALHPYAFHVEDLEAMVEQMREVVLENHDPGAGLYITEMGWGSQNDPNVVAFEQGIQGQARELRGAYRYMLDNRHRLNLKAAYWFTWKDSRYYCNFCDSVGLLPRSQPLPGRSRPGTPSSASPAARGRRPVGASK